MSDRVKILLAVVLLVVMAGAVGFRVYQLTGAPKEPAAPSAPAPASEAAAPAEDRGAIPDAGADADSEAPPPMEGEEGAEKPSPKEEADEVELTFVNEDVEKRFRGSRFFTRNTFEAMRDPFVPPKVLAAPKQPGEQAHPLALLDGETVETTGAPGEIGEISLLPLPSEVLGEETHFTLMGVSTGRGGSTGLFRMEATAGGEAPAAEQGVVMAHEGWLVGNDYIFLGMKGGRAQLLNRKNNSLILLLTGETV